MLGGKFLISANNDSLKVLKAFEERIGMGIRITQIVGYQRTACTKD